MLTFDLAAQRADGSVAARGQRTASVPAGARADALRSAHVRRQDRASACRPRWAARWTAARTVQPNCGNGVIDPGETCDTAIPAGQMGACPPADCDDGVACTKDEGSGDAAAPASARTRRSRRCTRRTAVARPARRPKPIRIARRPAATGWWIRARPATPPSPPARRAPARPATACKAEGPCAVAQLLSAETCSAICLRTAITTPMAGDGVLPGRRHQRGRSRLPFGVRRRCPRNRRDLRRRHPAPAARQLPGQLRRRRPVHHRRAVGQRVPGALHPRSGQGTDLG